MIDLFKKIILFILCFLPWLVATLIPVDYTYLESLRVPFFSPPVIFYPIAWTTIYLLLAYSISSIISEYTFKKIPVSYKISLLINYLFNQSFTPLFFGLKNNFLGFIACLGTFISSLFLYQETFQLKEKSTKVLDPYVLLSLFATVLALTIYVINTL